MMRNLILRVALELHFSFPSFSINMPITEEMNIDVVSSHRQVTGSHDRTREVHFTISEEMK